MKSSSPHPVSLKMKEAVQFIQSKTQLKPKFGIILGSGLGSIADELTDAIEISYQEIPHFHLPQVDGHAGKMKFGLYYGIPVVALQGRFHYYEGFSMEQVAFPTRVLCALGVQSLVLTNASGGINTRYKPGDIMVIEDHINLTGDNPLKGPNLSELGPRFPDMSDAYSRRQVTKVKNIAAKLKIELQYGVYAGVIGPSYETPAEIRMLRILGGDAVGMSTIAETIVANHFGVEVLGLSCITNLGAGMSSTKLTHQEVVDNISLSVSKLKQLLKEYIST